MKVKFKRLTEVKKSVIIELMNNPLVRRQMPLLKGNFSESDCDNFIAVKENLWKKHGYGPWAFVKGNRFVGLGGLQYDNGESDLALVLNPQYWGMGKAIYQEIIRKAFTEMGLQSVIVLFPPTRTRINGLLQLGFKEEKRVQVGGEYFIRYRLKNKLNG